MAQNVTIAGASYSDVPAVDIPKTGGGMAKFVDTSDANAAASDIQSGKTAYVNGQKVTGTGSGARLQSKSVTYTSNGSATVTPDSGYDGLSQVNVEVNVSGGGREIWLLDEDKISEAVAGMWSSYELTFPLPCYGDIEMTITNISINNKEWVSYNFYWDNGRYTSDSCYADEFVDDVVGFVLPFNATGDLYDSLNEIANRQT